jgi:hypothetical protein
MLSKVSESGSNGRMIPFLVEEDSSSMIAESVSVLTPVDR